MACPGQDCAALEGAGLQLVDAPGSNTVTGDSSDLSG